MKRADEQIQGSNSSKKIGRCLAAGFGAAMCSNYALPELQAGIYGLDFTPGSVAYTGSNSTSEKVIVKASSISLFSFFQLNDSASDGQVMASPGTSLVKWGFVDSGFSFTALTASNFAQGTNAGLDPGPRSNSSSGVREKFVAFEVGSGVGWFQVQFDNGTGPVEYDSGAKSTFADGGEQLTVGTFGATGGGGSGAVPEPAHVSLTLLALGAVGLRRRRASRKNDVASAE